MFHRAQTAFRRQKDPKAFARKVDEAVQQRKIRLADLHNPVAADFARIVAEIESLKRDDDLNVYNVQPLVTAIQRMARTVDRMDSKALPGVIGGVSHMLSEIIALGYTPPPRPPKCAKDSTQRAYTRYVELLLEDYCAASGRERFSPKELEAWYGEWLIAHSTDATESAQPPSVRDDDA